VAYEIVENGGVLRAEITNFWEMVFNPSTMPRFSHTVVGAFLQGAFLVLSVSAYFILKKRHVDLAQRAMRVGVIVVLIASFTELALGHWSAQVVAEHQPVKLAAMEGHYETAEGVSLTAIGWTDSEAETTTGIEIPKALSFLAFNDFEAEVKGLNDYPRDEWPDVEMVFMTFHIMVALGMLFIAYGVFGVFLLWRKAFFKQKWLLMATVPAVILPILANQLGWVTAERGRQPWVVQDLLRTKDAISKSVSAEEILASIIMFVLLYTLLFFVWVYVLNKEIKHGPELPKSLLKQDLYPQRHERVDVIGKSLPSGYVVKDEREKAAEKHKDQPTPVN
ncbi:MAG: cytochrome ubiquinol oxidase subunit I, partial [Bacteroidota bacterium]